MVLAIREAKGLAGRDLDVAQLLAILVMTEAFFPILPPCSLA